MERVTVYEDESCSNVVGVVEFNNYLDNWNGHEYSSGLGIHLGITKLRNGQFVIIHGTDWEGQHDTAFIVSKKRALQAILSSNHLDLLEKSKFAELKELYKNTMFEEEPE